MVFEEFEPYHFWAGSNPRVPRTASIGWLERSIEAPEPCADPVFLVALRRLVSNWSVNRTRGNHVCSLCSPELDVYVEIDGRTLLLGSGELWVPASEGDVVFVSPDLVLHYVEEHGYRPPEVFMAAVIDAELRYETWDPDEESQSMLREALSDQKK